MIQNSLNEFLVYNFFCVPVGYDQIPIDIQGLEIGSHGGGNGSTYSALEAMDVIDQLPTPPDDNNQVAAWYDTDL